MSDTQADLARDRLPLLRAAALKYFDVKVVNQKTGRESPFDLRKTAPGCFLNIRWKAPPADATTVRSDFLPLRAADAGVTEYTFVKYLDPASIAYELQAYATSNQYGPDPKEVLFQRTKIFRGLWTYAAMVESATVEEYGLFNMFWCMILHYHRTGTCLPPMAPEWTRDEATRTATCAYEQLLSKFHKGGLQEAIDQSSSSNNGNNNKNTVLIPAKVMSFVMVINQIMTAQRAGVRDMNALPDRCRSIVDFAMPLYEPQLPKWWRAHDALWTSTLTRFIATGGGVGPCSWLLKESGCKNKDLSDNHRNKCREDHTHFVPLVRSLEVLLKRPYGEQMETNVKTELMGQGTTIDKELSAAHCTLPPDERQTRLKEKGNAYVAKQDYTSAVLYYSEAIGVTGLSSPTPTAAIYSNRSLCYLNTNRLSEAVADAEKCVELRPDWFKGHYRQGAALERLGKYEEAIRCYERVGALDATQKADADECVDRCRKVLRLSEEARHSKSVQRELQQQREQQANKSGDEVTAVLFPCDPDVRPYEVKIPKNFAANPEKIHQLLGITSEEVANIDAYWAKTPTLVSEGTLPDEVFPMCYGVREWASDYSEETGRGIPFAFIPREICRGENNKSNLLALVNPQSKARPNMRMSAMLTKIESASGSIMDGNPATCKCRGDALVIRIQQSKADLAAIARVSDVGPGPLGNRYLSNDIRLMAWPKIKERINQLGRRAKEDPNCPEEVAALASGAPVGLFVELSAVVADILAEDADASTPEHGAIDFTYKEYDGVYGLFAQVEAPVENVKAQLAAKKGGKNKKVLGAFRRVKPSFAGPFFVSMLFPNTPECEKVVADILQRSLGRGGGGRGGRRR